MRVSVPKFPCFIRSQFYWIGAHHHNLITCQTLFPNKVTFTGPSSEDFNIFAGDTAQLNSHISSLVSLIFFSWLNSFKPQCKQNTHTAFGPCVCELSRFTFPILLFEVYFLLRFHLFTFRQRGREGEGEGGKHQGVVASHVLPTGDLAHNPGTCPDWESNRGPFGSQDSTQSTKSGLHL